MTDQDAIVKVASSGYPPGVAVPLFVSVHGDHAAVLLETGTDTHPYPYLVMCAYEDGHWQELASANMGGWYQTEDDNGAVVFWDDSDGLTEPVEIEFKGRRWPAEVKSGVAWSIWWDELDPGNLIDPHWPEIAV